MPFPSNILSSFFIWAVWQYLDPHDPSAPETRLCVFSKSQGDSRGGKEVQTCSKKVTLHVACKLDWIYLLKRRKQSPIRSPIKEHSAFCQNGFRLRSEDAWTSLWTTYIAAISAFTEWCGMCFDCTSNKCGKSNAARAHAQCLQCLAVVVGTCFCKARCSQFQPKMVIDYLYLQHVQLPSFKNKNWQKKQLNIHSCLAAWVLLAQGPFESQILSFATVSLSLNQMGQRLMWCTIRTITACRQWIKSQDILLPPFLWWIVEPSEAAQKGSRGWPRSFRGCRAEGCCSRWGLRSLRSRGRHAAKTLQKTHYGVLLARWSLMQQRRMTNLSKLTRISGLLPFSRFSWSFSKPVCWASQIWLDYIFLQILQSAKTQSSMSSTSFISRVFTQLHKAGDDIAQLIQKLCLNRALSKAKWHMGRAFGMLHNYCGQHFFLFITPHWTHLEVVWSLREKPMQLLEMENTTRKR